jgi:hypothetical protein
MGLPRASAMIRVHVRGPSKPPPVATTSLLSASSGNASSSFSATRAKRSATASIAARSISLEVLAIESPAMVPFALFAQPGPRSPARSGRNVSPCTSGSIAASSSSVASGSGSGGSCAARPRGLHPPRAPPGDGPLRIAAVAPQPFGHLDVVRPPQHPHRPARSDRNSKPLPPRAAAAGVEADAVPDRRKPRYLGGRRPTPCPISQQPPRGLVRDVGELLLFDRQGAQHLSVPDLPVLVEEVGAGGHRRACPCLAEKPEMQVFAGRYPPFGVLERLWARATQPQEFRWQTARV